MNALTLGPADRGRQVAVHTGDRIVLRLPENPTTGYRWAGDIPAFLSPIRDDNEAGAAPGAAGVRVLEFVAAAPGRAELSLGCTRAWDPSAPATDRFSVSITVE